MLQYEHFSILLAVERPSSRVRVMVHHLFKGGATKIIGLVRTSAMSNTTQEPQKAVSKRQNLKIFYLYMYIDYSHRVRNMFLCW